MLNFGFILHLENECPECSGILDFPPRAYPPTEILRSGGSGFLPELFSTNFCGRLHGERGRQTKPIGADSTFCADRNSASFCTWRTSPWSAADSSIFTARVGPVLKSLTARESLALKVRIGRQTAFSALAGACGRGLVRAPPRAPTLARDVWRLPPC